MSEPIKLLQLPIINYQDSEGNNVSFNVVGALGLIEYVIQSSQAIPLRLINNGDGYAQLQVPNVISEEPQRTLSDYFDYVISVTNSKPLTYLQVNSEGVTGAFNYTGQYEVKSYSLNLLDNSILNIVLKNVGNDAGTYFGDVEFSEEDQFVFRNKTQLQYDIYRVYINNGVSNRVFMTTYTDKVAINGTVTFAASEFAMPYIDRSAVGIEVEITQTDSQSRGDQINTIAQLNTPLVIFERAFMPKQLCGNYLGNYGTQYTGFTGVTATNCLPSTVTELQALKYTLNNYLRLPYYYNFCCSDSVLDNNWYYSIVTTTINSTGTTIVSDAIPIPNIGVNAIEIATLPNLVGLIDQIIKGNITPVATADSVSLRLTVTKTPTIPSQFSDAEFSDQFDIDGLKSITGGFASTIKVNTLYVGNNSAMYVTFQNSDGGISTLVCSDWERSTEPELIALRNKASISSSVARETEYLTLRFHKLTRQEFQYITGINTQYKQNGIYESPVITTYSPSDTTEGTIIDYIAMDWVPVANTYELMQLNFCPDFEITLMRSLFVSNTKL